MTWSRKGAAVQVRSGYARTGRRITQAFKSAINGAIRRGLLEYEGKLFGAAKPNARWETKYLRRSLRYTTCLRDVLRVA